MRWRKLRCVRASGRGEKSVECRGV
jgi:hypothetical protein